MNMNIEILRILKYSKDNANGFVQIQNIDRILLHKGITAHFELTLNQILNDMMKNNLISKNESSQFYITDIGLDYITEHSQ